MFEKPAICFTGNRPQKVKWLGDPLCDNYKHLTGYLLSILTQLYRKGYRHFISGMALGADTLAARCVLSLKKIHPDVTLECALPCKNQDDPWRDYDQCVYHKILKRADVITYVSDSYTPSCISRRNQYMVDKAYGVIAMWNIEKKGGTYQTIEYAKKQNKKLMIIELDKNFFYPGTSQHNKT